ncbi:MAG TPA: hypothetical protein VK166_07085 [Chitinophagaceae bacterium]|nr:hypothetical protein [Chitinophagaceae bacterium]
MKKILITGLTFILLAACYSCDSDKSSDHTMGNHQGMGESTQNHSNNMGYDSMMSHRDTVKQK